MYNNTEMIIKYCTISFLKPDVISRAVRMFACFRDVMPDLRHIWCICVSRGITSFDEGTFSHPPGSTSSFLTIQRKNRFILLHALPFSGKGIRCPGPFFADPVIFSARKDMAWTIVSSSFFMPARKHS